MDLGLRHPVDWKKIWESYFVGTQNSNFITIFPGSGHRLKNWPIENFMGLADALLSMGEQVRFVVGPVEIERLDLKVLSRFPVIISQDFETLQKTILESKLVIGNDSGPMHLAGFNGVPNITIFGPTNPKLWAPIDSLVISPNMDCSPCTSIIDIKCDKMLCLRSISWEMVWDSIRGLL